MIRKIWLWTWIVIIAILSLPFLLVAKIINNKELSLKMIHYVCKPINFFSGNNIHLIDFNNLTDHTDYVLVANHLSFFDILSLMSFIDKPIVFVAKKSLSKIPIATQWFNTQDTIYIDRDDVNSGITTMKKVIGHMKKHESVGLFPAGTRSSDEVEFKPGIIKIAQKNKKMIIPLTIQNTNLVLEDRKGNKKVDTYFTFHKPLTYEAYQHLSLEGLCKELEDIVYMRK